MYYSIHLYSKSTQCGFYSICYTWLLITMWIRLFATLVLYKASFPTSKWFCTIIFCLSCSSSWSRSICAICHIFTYSIVSHCLLLCIIYSSVLSSGHCSMTCPSSCVLSMPKSAGFTHKSSNGFTLLTSSLFFFLYWFDGWDLQVYFLFYYYWVCVYPC